MQPKGKNHRPQHKHMSRRAFLQTAGAAATGILLARCGVDSSTEIPVPATTTQPSAAATATHQPSPTPVQPTAAQPSPTPTHIPPTPVPTDIATPLPPIPTKPVSTSTKVAVGKVQSYDRGMIRNTLRDMVDSLGGFSDVVSKGDRVAIKTNLTGGLGSAGGTKLSPVNAYLTHPEVVQVLGELVLDAGASELLIVEAVYEWNSYVVWGYEQLAANLGATLIDLNGTSPYETYVTAGVPGGSEFYDGYFFNNVLQDIDVFMSVSKMKCHWNAGVTHTMKNLFGIVPAQFYRLSEQHNHRSGFHGPNEETAGYRVPRIIVELNKARPVHFSLIDGITTVDGGEGPWLPTFGTEMLQPGILIAGKNPVATDAVATAAQGFDPTASAMTVPFVRGDNHIALAHAAGLGTNRLDEIEVLGHAIDDVKMDFRPCVVET